MKRLSEDIRKQREALIVGEYGGIFPAFAGILYSLYYLCR